MNVLVVHEVSYADKVVYEYQEYAERLAGRGHNVTVIDFAETSGSARGERAISRTGAGTVTLRSTPYLDVPLVKYVSARRNYRALLRAAIAEGRVDVALVYSIFVNGTETLRQCRAAGIPVVYRVIDAYHKLRQNPWTMLPLYLGERYMYRNADVVCLMNEKLRAYVETVAGRPGGDRFTVVEPGVDTELFRPAPRDEALAAEFGIAPADRTALFVGSLYPFAGVDRVLANFDLLLEACPAAKLLVVGDGPLLPGLRRTVEERGLAARVVLAGRRPFVEVPRWLSLADVAFNSFQLNDVTRDIVPIKMLQYLATGRPVLSAPIADVMRLFPAEQSGALYEEIADGSAFARRLGALLQDDAHRSQLARRARETILRKWSLERTIDDLERVLRASRHT